MVKAFVFPGQGAQSVGMGKEFFDNFSVAKDTFNEVDSALGKKLSQIIFEGPQDLLTQTENAQPAIMCVSIAILRVLEQESGIKLKDAGKFIAGHSLGEYSALAAGGSLSLGDTAKLLKTRGESFASASKQNPGSMCALLGADVASAQALIAKAKIGDEVLQIANDNTVGQIVISGGEKSIANAVTLAPEMGIKKAVQLAVSGAFHSVLMQPAVKIMEEALKDVVLTAPVLDFIPNVEAKTESSPDAIKANLVKQIVSQVRWRETLLFLESNSVDEIIEVGPGKTLAGLTPRTLQNCKSFSINSLESLKEYIQ